MAVTRADLQQTTIPLPRVLELPEAQARGKLTQLGLRPRIESQRPSDPFPSGAVIWQDPPSGTVLPPNSVVQLVVSSGPGGVRSLTSSG